MIQIDTKTRQGRMLDGMIRGGNRNAKVVVTVQLERLDGRQYHQTLRFKAYDSRAGRNAGCRVVAADLMDGDWSEGTYSTKVLEWNVTRGEEQPGWNRGAGRYSDALVIYAARVAWKYLTESALPDPSNGTVTAQERALCGCCGRELDREESIELGIGPECARRIGLEHHYRSSTVASSRRRRAAGSSVQLDSLDGVSVFGEADTLFPVVA